MPLLGKVDSANYLFEKAPSQWSEESNRIYKIWPLLKKGFLKTFLFKWSTRIVILYLSGGNSGVGCAYLYASLLGIFGKGI